VRWPRAAFVAAVLLNLVVLFSPRAGGGQLFPHADSVVHVVVFALVAVTGRLAGLPAGPLGLVLVVHAVESELVQHYWLTQRSGDPVDAVSDVVGVLVGLLLAWMLARRGPRAGTPRAARPGRIP
jgi:hypothetical protein